MRIRPRSAQAPFLVGVILGLLWALAVFARALLRGPGPMPMALLKDGPTSVDAAPSAPEPESARADYDRLRARAILIPVVGFDSRQLRDSFAEPRPGHAHGAIDLLAPRGTVVRAVDDGTVRRLSSGDRGGISVYEVDLDGRYCYYYAHLDHYAARLHEGQALRRGDTVGYVGSTGNASLLAPHLHFAVSRIEDTAHWSQGTPIDPYWIWVLKIPPG